MDDVLAGFPVVVEQAVLWGEMDAMRHVNNVAYFRYFENARLEFFRRLDWDGIQAATGVGPILHSTQARFRLPLTYPDTIRIGARVKEMSVDRFVLEHRIFSQRLAAIATEGTGTVVAFDYLRGQKVSIPADLKLRIDALEASAPVPGAP
jgi:acyl-CoA thioester hydrolase